MMSETWTCRTWGDLATLEYGKGLREYDSTNSVYPVFGTNGQIGWHSSPLRGEAGIVIGRKGAYRGVHYSPKPFFVIDTAFYIKPKENFDLKWAYYQLKDFDINKIDSGSAIPSTSREAFYAIPVSLPPLPVQRRIAAVLAAYDDLIENNTRRIQILEEMAQALYREWFVHFRFPGHDKSKTADSALASIPEGWEATTIGDVVGIMGGGTPSTANPEFWTGGSVTWYSPSDLTAANSMFITRSEKMITPLGLQKSSARLFPPYCVMMTSRATIGVVSINTSEACTNQGFITCIPSARVSALQLYFWVKENKEKIISVASGATFKEINKATFRNLSIVVADPDTTTRFEGLLGSLGKQIENLLRKNTNLRRTRDLLLPKLISGEVSVDDLDIETGETDSTESEAEGASRAPSA